jgi:hypothetical protein
MKSEVKASRIFAFGALRDDNVASMIRSTEINDGKARSNSPRLWGFYVRVRHRQTEGSSCDKARPT